MAFPKIEGYVVTEKLGSGSYSTVYKAYAKVGARSIVAVKCVDKSRIKNSGSAVDNLITEIRLLKTLEHPHIVHMKHFTWDDKNIYIIMEYCCGGDLSRYIQRYGRVPEKQVLYFLQQLASALKFLREKGMKFYLSCCHVHFADVQMHVQSTARWAGVLQQDVVHMDLKPHNLLLHKGSDGKYILKVADFGFAQYICSSAPRGVRGSPLYMAPEMLLGRYDARVDLWSVGVIMYECLFGRAPYASNTFKELVDKIERHANIQIPPNSSISPGCRDLLTRLLKHNPDERISYEEFFNHEYLDLEHMPSKENYEKAVSLIKLAIECDGAGRSRDAFNLYRDALRYLVPAVTAETDSVRRGALAAKLNRYMERAEELKQYLKCGEQSIPTFRNAGTTVPTVPASAVTCCGTSGTTSTSSYEYGHVQTPICAACTCVPGVLRNGTDIQCSCTDSNDARQDLDEGGPIEEKEVTIEPPPAEANTASANTNANVRSRAPARFGLKRLFGKQNSMPYLTNNDSSITGSPSEKHKVPADDPASDGCRIT